jgi:hypothetical protein
MKRGIIGEPAITQAHGDSFTFKRGISPQELRYYILYWDRVVIPVNNIISIGLPEEEILIKSGAIERPSVVFSGFLDGKATANSYAIAQAIIAQKLMTEDKSTDWVIHQIGNQLNIPDKFSEPRNSLRFDLVNLLPVPNGLVPIPDILEFKERRKDELNALHNRIEEVYIEALKCPDPSFGRNRAITELQEIINNVNKVTQEKWDNTSKFDFTIEFNFDIVTLLKGISSGTAIAFFTDVLTIPLGATLGGIASMFKFKASYSKSFIPAAKNSKLAFLSNASAEEII